LPNLFVIFSIWKNKVSIIMKNSLWIIYQNFRYITWPNLDVLSIKNNQVTIIFYCDWPFSVFDRFFSVCNPNIRWSNVVIPNSNVSWRRVVKTEETHFEFETFWDQSGTIFDSFILWDRVGCMQKQRMKTEKREERQQHEEWNFVSYDHAHVCEIA